RAWQGSPMPLAIKRLTRGELPARITLDESLAMNPAMTLASDPEVEVVARVSFAGTAAAAPGDIEGRLGRVKAGAHARPLSLVMAGRIPAPPGQALMGAAKRRLSRDFEGVKSVAQPDIRQGYRRPTTNESSMRLKSIKLAGFKSFVDPTTVHFPSNLCAVVGPNGCGKSNVIDAVRWVMGESSAKHLRGESMTDVIFNGSGGRKPVGQASIELIFDNSDGTLGGEYASYAEISIRRKVTRDGQSSYYLNGNKCRRRDITDIFLGTGLGPRSYAIIEQGMISNLIEARPEALRVFMEEAAGISKCRERRRDTGNRLRRTQVNLERLTDIRDELGRQLQRLERQAQAAEKYAEFKKEERQAKAQLQALRWRQLNAELQSRQTLITRQELDVEALVTERSGCDNTLEKLRARYTDESDGFNATQGEFYAIGAEVARTEQSIEHVRQRARELRQDIEQTER